MNQEKAMTVLNLIDEHKESLPDGVYKEIVDNLMNIHNDDNKKMQLQNMFESAILNLGSTGPNERMPLDQNYFTIPHGAQIGSIYASIPMRFTFTQPTRTRQPFIFSNPKPLPELTQQPITSMNDLIPQDKARRALPKAWFTYDERRQEKREKQERQRIARESRQRLARENKKWA